MNVLEHKVSKYADLGASINIKKNWSFAKKLFDFPFFDNRSQWFFFLRSVKICPSKALFTRDILTHNIAIKRYYDKNIFLSHWFLLVKVSSQRTTNQGTLCFVKSLPWLVIEIHGSKISFYLNIFLSKYCVPKCLVWIKLY